MIFDLPQSLPRFLLQATKSQKIQKTKKKMKKWNLMLLTILKSVDTNKIDKKRVYRIKLNTDLTLLIFYKQNSLLRNQSSTCIASDTFHDFYFFHWNEISSLLTLFITNREKIDVRWSMCKNYLHITRWAEINLSHNTNEMASSLFLKRVREVKETHFVKIPFGFVGFFIIDKGGEISEGRIF